MPTHAIRLFAITCLLFAAGCVTDKAAVYKKVLLDKEAMKPLLGEYAVEKWLGTNGPKQVSVSEKGGKYSVSYSLPGKKIDVKFVASKIPNSKRSLHLLALPSQSDTNQANLFFIGRVEKERTHLWTVLSDMPVAEGQLEFEKGKTKAADLKKFLSKHGDEFIKANKPVVVLKKTKA
jgi:hypothetical protein